MKRFSKLILCLMALCSLGVASAAEYASGYPQTSRTKERLTQGWRYRMGDADAKFYASSTNDSQWEEVTIPHTLALTSIDLDGCKDDKYQKTFHRTVGWYRRDVTPSKNAKRVVLDFEGAHQVTTLWVNGREVGVHKVGGYTPFYFDITPYVKRGVKNQVTLLVDNRVSEVTPPDPGMFDYVKFSGLYRDVYLVETSDIYITPNIESMNAGVTITTPSIDYANGNATIDIRTEVRNASRKAEKMTIMQRVVDAEGNVVLKMESSEVIPAGATYRFVQTGGVEDDVKFWNLNDPYLYRVNTLLLNSAGEKIDVVDNRLGLRKIEYDYETGFKINGKNIEIVGMNRHQHYAYIGDAMPNSLHYKDIIQLKKLGFNTLRTAHYPHDDEILKACDELGMLVYEEAPTWIAISTHKEWFENFHESQRRMIRNHKNSPSVFIWGAGINHRGAVASAQFVSKQEDPTRLTASQSSRWTGWQNSSWTDIFGNMNYGPGIWNREEPLLAMEGPYGPEAMAPYFRDPMMPGLIGWTAHAYYTFHDPKDGDWTKRTRSGAMDAFRYPRTTRLLWYPSEMTTKPYIYVVDDWAPETKMLTIYSNAEYLTLELNGRSAGRFYPSRALKYNGLQHAPFEISTLAYADGEVVIKGWREGEQILEKAIYTPQAAQKLKLIVDKYDMDLVADGSDIMVVHAEVLDANGMRLRDFKGEISFKVDGDATIVGDGTNIRSNPVEIRLGKGSALIRAGKKAGNITVSASCGTLTPSSVTFASVPAEFDCMKADSYVINDNETLMLDLGAEGQLIQFGWTPWMPSDEKSAVAHVAPAVLDDLTAGDTPSPISAAEVHDKWQDGDYTFTIASASSAGVMRWLGEMNLIGKDNFVYGDGVLCIDEKGVDLTIEKLPVGEYTLRTYHHAPASNTNSMDPNRERLQKESIHKLPFSKSLEISVAGKVAASNVAVTSGKNQQLGSPSISEVKFSVKKSGDKVKLNYKSLDKNAGVWINGLELVRSL